MAVVAVPQTRALSVAKAVLVAAAVYNVAFGAWAVLWPSSAFELAGLEPPNYPELWQCIGMIVGVYGIGYAIAQAFAAEGARVTIAGQGVIYLEGSVEI